MKKLKILKLSPDSRYLQTLSLKLRELKVYLHATQLKRRILMYSTRFFLPISSGVYQVLLFMYLGLVAVR